MIFESFWDVCGGMLGAIGMGGMDEMGNFYDNCIESLYPPGSCGTFCNDHTFDCYVSEFNQACCDEGGANCPPGSSIPTTCPVGCAIVFPEFLETCRDHMDTHPDIDLPAFESFEQECLDLEGIEIVEYAMELIQKGCSLDLQDGHRRRQLQGFLAGRLGGADPDTSTCSWDQLDEKAAVVDTVCCGRDGSMCTEIGQPPQACSLSCAVALHQFTTECSETLNMVLEPSDPLRANMENFEGACMDAAESSDLFLEAVTTAQCPDDGDVIILRERGASATGWSNSEITDAGSSGNVHGPWGNDVTDVSIDFELPSEILQCEISWRSWAVDSRDNEIDSVLVDGAQVWSIAASCPVPNPSQPVAPTGWEYGPSDFPNPWQGEDDGRVCVAAVTVIVPCSGSVNLQFHSGIDQAENDESWAFSDVQIIGTTGEVVILDETGASSPTGWSNPEITDTGSAGPVHGPWGNDCTSNSIDINIPPGLVDCKVSWRSWSIDSRDRETDRVLIDGNEVWSNQARCWGSDVLEGWEYGPIDFPNPYGGQVENQVCFDAVEVFVPCSDTMHVQFESGTDQPESDEAWAFSEFRVAGFPPLLAVG